MAYLWFKYIHVVSIICWMAGLLYLYRLFVYHVENIRNDDIHQLITVMEKKLYRYITVPSMIFAWLAAIGMIVSVPSIAKQPWLHIKMLLAFGMTIITFYGGYFHARLSAQSSKGLSSKFFRIMNEVPTILLLLIIYLVVFKPWS